MHMCFSAEGRAAKIFQGLSKHTLVLLQVGKHDKVCDAERLNAGRKMHLCSTFGLMAELQSPGAATSRLPLTAAE